MADATFTFPADFKWGTATSSHQVEGGNDNNDWSEWEQAGREAGDGRVFQNQVSGSAAEWWLGRAEDDIKLMAGMGVNAHRLSLEWSRIEPQPGEWDNAALDRYRAIIGALRDAGIEPMVTLHHFTNPRWLAAQGGWADEDSVEHFTRYVRRVADTLSDVVDLWCTVNEPGVLAAQGYNLGNWPPGVRNVGAFYRASLNLLKAHAAAYRVIHQQQPEARVGLAKHQIIWRPRRAAFPGDWLAARMLAQASDSMLVRALMEGEWKTPTSRVVPVPELRGTLDWWGINYYQRYDAFLNLTKPASLFMDFTARPGAPSGPEGWGEFYPEGLYELIQRAVAYDLPIYITENGLPDEYDSLRPGFLIEHLRQVWRAINFNWPVMGYYFWSIVDNFEWAEGYDPRFRFGLAEVDFETQGRVLRASGELYAEICQSGTLTADMARRYAPETLATIFPGEVPGSA